MLPFLKKIFSRRSRKYRLSQGLLDLDIETGNRQPQKQAEADVHRLMIEATRIRKQKGYPAAIGFLRELAATYLAEKNTALVTCMNKLIPYMKREKGTTFEQTESYLSDIIRQVPLHEPYFRNLHLTMADLIEEEDPERALKYIMENLRIAGADLVDYDLRIKAAEIHTLQGRSREALEQLDIASSLLNPRLDRYVYIRKLRKWYQVRSLVDRLENSIAGATHFLLHRYMEFALDMARVLDPLQISQFHDRKDLYYKKERGFENTEPYRQAMEILDLGEKHEKLLEDIYGFVFEEMPALLKVTPKQLNFKPGEEESLAELQEKKRYSRRPFTELAILENKINQILHTHL